jgi:adenosylcobinamide-GDP ribazoletransferase
VIAALRFLTVLPLPGPHRAPTAGSLVAFPLAGAVVGVVWVATAIAAEAVAPSLLLVAAVVLVADAGITGGLHLDALADVADGVASRRPAEEAVRVMRDSAVGAGGVVAVVLACLVRQAALLSVLGAQPRPWSLVAVPVAGRAAMVLVLALVPARTDGSLAGAVPRPGPRTTAASLAVAAACAAAAAGPRGAAVLVLALAVTAGYAAWWRRRFGGLSGDGAGAVGVLAETLALLGLVVPG